MPAARKAPASLDRLTKERRSWNMSRIRSKDTKPELLVRRLLHGMGVRYRLHRTGLPGKPDIVLGPRRLVIFVHGCFWHQHPGCREATMPTGNRDFWKAKLEGNAARDQRHRTALRKLGWRVAVIWECETRHPDKLARRLTRLLQGPAPRQTATRKLPPLPLLAARVTQAETGETAALVPPAFTLPVTAEKPGAAVPAAKKKAAKLRAGTTADDNRDEFPPAADQSTEARALRVRRRQASR